MENLNFIYFPWLSDKVAEGCLNAAEVIPEWEDRRDGALPTTGLLHWARNKQITIERIKALVVCVVAEREHMMGEQGIFHLADNMCV